MIAKSVFRSAISGTDGEVDSGYLALYYTLFTIIVAILLMCIYAGVQLWIDPAHPFDPQTLGIGIGAVSGGFATIVAAVGAFRMGDKPAPAAVGVTTTTAASQSKVTTEVAPAKAPVPATKKGKR